MAREYKEVDFCSEDFSPEDALNNPNINFETEDIVAEACLESVREKLHSEDLSSLPTDAEIPGPGGIPLAKAKKTPLERNFTSDQAPIPARVKPVRNVLTRMAAAEGPLHMLLTAKTNSSSVKVYTRSDRGVRSVMTGTLLAFDKHFNLVLRDVSEVFCAQRRYKRHAIDGKDGDFVKIADLSIKDTDEDEQRAVEQLRLKKLRAQSQTEFSPLQEFLVAVKDRPMTSQVTPPEMANLEQTPCARSSGENLPSTSAFGKSTSSIPAFGASSMHVSAGVASLSLPEKTMFQPPTEGYPRSYAYIPETKTFSKSSHHSIPPSETTKQLHLESNQAEIRHLVRGARLEGEIASDQSREAAMLKLAREARQSYNPEDYNYRYDSRAKSKGREPMGKNARDTLEKVRDSDASVSSESDHLSAARLSPTAASDSHVKRSKRKRVKKKREIRKRFVKQLLIRGENVVLVSAVDS